MQRLPALVLTVAITPLVLAAEEKPAGKDCPLCKLPGRAALFAGAVKTCPAHCAKLCCTGRELTFTIEGLGPEPDTAPLKAALAGLEGVETRSLSQQAGLLVLRHDPKKISDAQLAAAIKRAGFKIGAVKSIFTIPAMKDDAAARAVEQAIESHPGIQGIATVCSRTRRAVVSFDPDKTSRDRVAAAIGSSSFKVAEDLPRSP